ncbi:MAG: hypothetical protein ACOYN0_16460, partial [Phycisphaerales bacterium]
MSNEEPEKPRVIPKVEGDAEAYELLPPDPSPTPPPPPAPKLEGPRFIDTIDDDADLTDAGPADDGDEDEPQPTAVAARGAFVEAGRGDAAIIGAVGAGVCVVACVCAAVFAKGGRFPAAVLSLLHTSLFTVAGLVSLGITAHLVGKSFGDLALGASRMFLAVALGVVWLSIDLPIGPRVVEPVLGAAFYFCTLWVLMRKDVRDIAKVAVFHFIIGMVLLGAISIFAWARAGAAAG